MNPPNPHCRSLFGTPWETQGSFWNGEGVLPTQHFWEVLGTLGKVYSDRSVKSTNTSTNTPLSINQRHEGNHLRRFRVVRHQLVPLRHQQKHPREVLSSSTPGSEATSTSALLPPSEGGVSPSAAVVRQASLCLGPGKPSDLSPRRSHPCGTATPSSRSRRSTNPLPRILLSSSSVLLASTSHRQQRLYRKSKNPIQERAKRRYWTLAVSNIRIEMVGVGRQQKP